MGKTILDFLSQYSLENEISAASVEQYQIAANRFSAWLGRQALISDFQSEAVNSFLRDYSARVSPHTVKSKRRNLMVLWRAAAEHGFVAEPGKIRQVKVPETQRDYWTLDEIREFVSVTLAMAGRCQTVLVKRSDYYTGMVLAAYETGLRMADLLSLDRSCLDANWFSVRISKTGAVQWCRLNEETKRIIHRTFDEIAPPRQLCWPTWGRGDLASRAKPIRRELVKAMKQAGLTASDGPFKKLRRSSINAVDQMQPGAGQHQAGHTSASTTQRWYLSADSAKNRPIPAPALS